ncbi:hypothetical protein NUH88_14130 [Nisaea acidiphila]|uniref:Uncharacterized protein n=1 Tax=Nisaea acidiphila TaxID=1862145 RepID=A0A9J7ALM2_9PROT|nr:hypothetical protein [Nisaea acidiphila]UUX48547.1 hypothetical protein NUH88_14130 [Nisaea acidiphila]
MIEAPGTGAISALLEAAAYWAYAGMAVAAFFLTIGIDRFDPGSRGSYLFRLLLLPATIVFWPVVIWRWAVVARSGDDR